MFPEGPNSDWIKMLMYALLAAAGGTMGHMMRTLDNGLKIRLGRTLLEGISAAFVGLLVFLTCQAIAIPMLWTGVIVGLSGWMGASASIRFVEKIVYTRLGLSTDETTSSKKNGKE